jgi:hypothetical protein
MVPLHKIETFRGARDFYGPLNGKSGSEGHFGAKIYSRHIYTTGTLVFLRHLFSSFHHPSIIKQKGKKNPWCLLFCDFLMTLSLKNDVNGTRFARSHFRTQKSLDFHGQPLPMLLVMDVERLKTITYRAI